MGLTVLPTKTDGSIGRVKTTLPGSNPSPDLDYYVTRDEFEREKTAVVDVCAEVGLNDGSTAGSLVARVVALESAGAGINELTGDVTAGPGSGSQAATVARIQTRPVSAAAPALNDVLAWNGAAWAPVAPVGANPVGPAVCIFVDSTAGNDGTGTRGRADLPFLTIAAAFGAIAAAGDTIVLSPGVHTVLAPIAEPVWSEVSVVGYGSGVTRIDFLGGVGDVLFTCQNAVTVRFTLRGLTIAQNVSTIGLVANGLLAGGTFMSIGGIEMTDVEWTRTPGSGGSTAFILTACNRIALQDVTVLFDCVFDTSWAQPNLSIDPSFVNNLRVTGSTSIAWDDDIAQAFGFPITREPMRFRECALANVVLDTQPIVYPERCTYRGLTSANPLGNSVSGVAAKWWERDCIADADGGFAFIDFTGPQAITDLPVVPTFAFSRAVWAGPTGVSIERTGNATRQTVFMSDIDNLAAGFSALAPGLGVDMQLFGVSLMPAVVPIVPDGTFTPGVYTVPAGFTGVLAAGPNAFLWPWGAAGFGPNAATVSPLTAGETLAVTATNALGFTIDATVGGSNGDATFRWTNGY
jgi:hypothetical protein